MSVKELFGKIESPEFDAEVNLANTKAVLFSVLTNSSSHQALVAYLREHPSHAVQVLQRVKSLVTVKIDYRYSNPYDSALASYVWAMAKEKPRLGRIAAEVALTANNIVWARELAELALQAVPARTSSPQASTTPVEFSFRPARHVVDLHNLFAPHEIILGSLFLAVDDISHFRVIYARPVISLAEQQVSDVFSWPSLGTSERLPYQTGDSTEPHVATFEWGK